MVATLYRHPDGLGQIRIDAARMCIEIVNKVEGTRASAVIGPRGLIARFAMKGAAVHRLADGGFIVAQWGLSRHCVDFASLMAFARQMGVI